MKVYLEEKDMPKDYKTTCKNCPFRGDEGLGCEEIRMLDKDFICPLQSLTDHTKQVRKEVCEILDKRIHNYLSNKCRYAESLDVHSIIKQVIKEELDQIQGETNGSKN